MVLVDRVAGTELVDEFLIDPAAVATMIDASTLADTAKQLVRVYAQQQDQLTKLANRVAELEKGEDK